MGVMRACVLASLFCYSPNTLRFNKCFGNRCWGVSFPFYTGLRLALGPAAGGPARMNSSRFGAFLTGGGGVANSCVSDSETGCDDWWYIDGESSLQNKTKHFDFPKRGELK